MLTRNARYSVFAAVAILFGCGVVACETSSQHESTGDETVRAQPPPSNRPPTGTKTKEASAESKQAPTGTKEAPAETSGDDSAGTKSSASARPTSGESAGAQTQKRQAEASANDSREMKFAEKEMAPSSTGSEGATGSKRSGSTGTGEIHALADKSSASDGPAAEKSKRARRAAPSPSRESYRDPAERRPRPPEPTTEVNEFVQTSEDAKSTFAVDVDTGSYTRARQAIRNGGRPSPGEVRVEEFVNYFDYGYAGPDSGPFAVHTEGAPSPWSGKKNRYLMRVGVQGDRLTEQQKKPVHLTFLVDVSGSMRSPNKLDLAKKSLRTLVDNLDEEDTVALATYAGQTRKVLDPTSAAKSGRIKSAISRLHAGGSTAMNSGLNIAYKLALRNFQNEHVNRVIVLSDGNANVGPSSHDKILDRIEGYVEKGVTLSTIGFGGRHYRDQMMEQLANNGNGNYFFIDSMDQARRVFEEKLTGTLQTIAKDVKLQVEFNDQNVEKYRLVGYENRNVKDKNFRNEEVDAGEIGAGHTVTAIYELQVAENADGRLATVRVRHKPPQGSNASEQSFPVSRAYLHDEIHEASTGFRFAASVAAFAEKLRNSPYADDLSMALVEELASSSAGDSSERREFVRLVKAMK